LIWGGSQGPRPLPSPETPSPNPYNFMKRHRRPACALIPWLPGLAWKPGEDHPRRLGVLARDKTMTFPRIAAGRIVAVSVSDRKGVVKHNVPAARLLAEHGLEGDAHAEGGCRQVSLLSLASIHKMVARGAAVAPGDFAENLTVEGLEVMSLPVGTRLKVGAQALLEITQIGKVCHKGCAIREQVGDCVMPREGVFARVLQEGLVKVGDAIEVVA